MHGLGDSAEGFADVAQMFAQRMTSTLFVLPTAPNSPVSINMGMRMPSWYDITGLSDRANENCEGIAESRARISKILDDEHAKGVPFSRMVLSGFSQGGAMSLFTGLQMPAEKKLAAILVMSGYLPAKDKFALSDGAKDTPVLHCHGTADPMVAFEWAQLTQTRLVEMGVSNYKLEPFEGMQHTVLPQELGMALQFLQERLPDAQAVAGAASSSASASKSIDDMSVEELKAAISNAGLGDQAVGLLEKQELAQLLQRNAGQASDGSTEAPREL
ncbi:Acyl-protein thioesterase 1 [Durusdinium trenchii]|uniref:Acyl-protein thioesterase 1 n=1 Tax=Durusdinium trenchii TaxID=1381693 RepID=A0ABP0KL82_9DINO